MAANKLSSSGTKWFSSPSSPDFTLKMRTAGYIDRLTIGEEAWKLRVDGKSAETLKTNFMVTKYSLPARLTAVPKEKRPKPAQKSLINPKIENFLSRFSSRPQDSQPAKKERRGIIGWKLSMSRPITIRRHQSKGFSPSQPPREGVREDRELYLQYLSFKHRRAESSV